MTAITVGALRGLRAELARYRGLQPILALATVPVIAAVMAVSGLGDLQLYPERAAAIAALATPAGAVSTAITQLATATGVVAAIIVAVFGWLADIQYGMAVTLSLFEQRRWRLLACKTIVALMILVLVTVTTAGTVLATMAVGLTAKGWRGAPERVPWTEVAGQGCRLLPVLLFYLAVAVTAAKLLRALTATITVVAGLLLLTLPLVTVPAAARWLPHRWIADWMGLGESTQFITYYWPSSAGPSPAAAPVVLTLAVAACVVGLGSCLRAAPVPVDE